MSIEANLGRVEERVARACHRAGRSPQEVTIVAVAKTVPAERIRMAFSAGIKHFGENRVQEARDKLGLIDEVALSATWHMVGHLQSNKAKLALKIFHTIDSLDSLNLAKVLNENADRKVPVLLQVNVTGETTKSGVAPEDVAGVLGKMSRFPNLDIRGLMGIAPLVDDPEDIRPIFRRLYQLWDSLGLKELSMGMTDDFEVAIEEGSTMIRIGRAIFGKGMVI